MKRQVVALVVIASLLSAQLAAAKPPVPPPPAKPPATAAAPPAPPPPPPTPPAPPTLAESLTGDAKADYDTAVIIYGDKDYANAFLKFSSAYDKSHDPRLLWNMATCQKQLRHYTKVIQLLQRYVAEGGDKITEGDKKDAADLISTLEPLTGKVEIKVTEPGADIYVDDEKVGTSPLAAPIQVDVGTRKLRVVKADFQDYNATFVGEGTTNLISVKLLEVSHEGRLAITTQSDGLITIDGKGAGTGSFAGPVTAGPHVIRVTAPKFIPYQVEVSLAAKETRSLSIVLEHEKGISPWIFVGIGLGAAAAAALTVAIIYAVTYRPDPVGTLDPYTLYPK